MPGVVTIVADQPRQVPPELMWRVARNTLGRMACAYADPQRDGHDHAELCLRDDEAYAADRMLALLGAAVAADEGLVLDHLTVMLDSMEREG